MEIFKEAFEMKHIYAMRRSDGAVKIGFSANPEQRLSTVGSAIRMVVTLEFVHPKCKKFERVEDIAQKLCVDKHNVGEWFWITVDEAKRAIERAVRIVDGLEPDVTIGVKLSKRYESRSLVPCRMKRVLYLSAGKRTVYMPTPRQLEVLERLRDGESVHRADVQNNIRGPLVSKKFAEMDEHGNLSITEAGLAVLVPEALPAPDPNSANSADYNDAMKTVLRLMRNDQIHLARYVLEREE